MSSRKIIKNAFKLGALSLSAFSLNVYASIDCSTLTTWELGQTHTAGSQVKAQNNAYEAKWWTQANPLENAGQYQEWLLLGACDSAVNDNQSPIITEITPGNGSLFNDKDNVVILAQATDSDGSVAGVEFFVDGISIAVFKPE